MTSSYGSSWGRYPTLLSDHLCFILSTCLPFLSLWVSGGFSQAAFPAAPTPSFLNCKFPLGISSDLFGGRFNLYPTSSQPGAKPKLSLEFWSLSFQQMFYKLLKCHSESKLFKNTSFLLPATLIVSAKGLSNPSPLSLFPLVCPTVTPSLLFTNWRMLSVLYFFSHIFPPRSTDLILSFSLLKHFMVPKGPKGESPISSAYWHLFLFGPVLTFQPHLLP